MGRTGSFIVVDTILDALRRDYLRPSTSAEPKAPAITPGHQKRLSAQQPGPERVETGASTQAIPELDDSTARATDRQYQTDSFARHRRQPAPSLGSGDDPTRRPSLSSAVTSISQDRRSDRLSEMYVSVFVACTSPCIRAC